MGKKLKICVVIPAYNEGGVIERTLRDVRKYADRIIVVDDGSADATSANARGPKTVVLRHSSNLGQGAALQTGIELARTLDPAVLVTFDADGQFLAREIPDVVKPIAGGKVDVVLGSRFKGKTTNLPRLKLITLKAGILFTSIFSGIKLTDVHNGFRAFSPAAAGKINITQNGMAHASEIVEIIKDKKLRYAEVGTTVIYNNYAKKKGQKWTGAVRIFADLFLKRIY